MKKTKSKILGFKGVMVLIALTGCKGQALDPSAKPPAPEAPPVAEQPITESNGNRGELPHELFPTAAQALEAVLRKTDPIVVGFGELHQQNETQHTRSSLERFNRSLLPILAPRTSDLIVETWVSQGSCGHKEQEVVAHVEEISDRPPATEDENITLLKTAKHLGIKPHILEMQCSDYERLLDPAGNVDYFGLLELVGRRLGEKGAAVLAGQAGAGKMVAIYSGDIHNDLAPADDFKAFTYAKTMQAAAGGRYVEVDLYVPELIEQSELLQHEPWYPLIKRLASQNNAVLIEKSETSYIIIYQKGIKNPKQPLH